MSKPDRAGSVRQHRPLAGGTVRVNEDSAEVREVERNGRKYLVFPIIAAREMVLDYPEHGTRELLSRQRLKESEEMWAGTPITFIHPENPARTADRPEEYTETVIGQAYSPSVVDDEKLRVQAWVDVQKALDIGGLAEDVVEQLRNGEDVSVSAGYATLDDDRSGGVHNGQEYDIEQGYMIPDHIAVFPSDEFQARCTWEDGCGAPRVNVVNSDEVVTFTNVGGDPLESQDALERFLDRLDEASDGTVKIGDTEWPADDYAIHDRPVTVTGISVTDAEDIYDEFEDEIYALMRPRTNVAEQYAECSDGECSCGYHVNALEEARTPTYDGLTSAAWTPPSFTDYMEEWYSRNDREAPDSIETGTVAQEALEWAAARTLVGDPEGESAGEVISFPVVNLDDDLNENALQSARTLAHNSQAEESILEVTANLLEKHSSGDQTWPSGNTYDFDDKQNVKRRENIHSANGNIRYARPGEYVMWDGDDGPMYGQVVNIEADGCLTTAIDKKCADEENERVVEIVRYRRGRPTNERALKLIRNGEPNEDNLRSWDAPRAAREMKVRALANSDTESDRRNASGEVTVEIGGRTIDLTPPDAVVNAAELALEKKSELDELSDCGSGRGEQRANQIIDGNLAPEDFLTRENGTPIPVYLDSHSDDVSGIDSPPTEWSDETWTDGCGPVQYALWGGTATGTGLSWAEGVKDDLEAAIQAAEDFTLNAHIVTMSQETINPDDLSLRHNIAPYLASQWDVEEAGLVEAFTNALDPDEPEGLQAFAATVANANEAMDAVDVQTVLAEAEARETATLDLNYEPPEVEVDGGVGPHVDRLNARNHVAPHLASKWGVDTAEAISVINALDPDHPDDFRALVNAYPGEYERPTDEVANQLERLAEPDPDPRENAVEAEDAETLRAQFSKFLESMGFKRENATATEDEEQTETTTNADDSNEDSSESAGVKVGDIAGFASSFLKGATPQDVVSLLDQYEYVGGLDLREVAALVGDAIDEEPGAVLDAFEKAGMTVNASDTDAEADISEVSVDEDAEVTVNAEMNVQAVAEFLASHFNGADPQDVTALMNQYEFKGSFDLREVAQLVADEKDVSTGAVMAAIDSLQGNKENAEDDVTVNATDIDEGDTVKWDWSGGTAYGRVVELVANGQRSVDGNTREVSSGDGEMIAVIEQMNENGESQNQRVLKYVREDGENENNLRMWDAPDSAKENASDGNTTENATTMQMNVNELASQSAFGVSELQDWADEELMALEQTILSQNPELGEDESEESGHQNAETESDSGEETETADADADETKENSAETTESDSDADADNSTVTENNETETEASETEDSDEETKENSELQELRNEVNELKAMVEDVANQKANAEKERHARIVANAIDGMDKEAALELPEDKLEEMAETHANKANFAAVPGQMNRTGQEQKVNAQGEDASDYPAGGRSAYEQRKQSSGGD